MRLRSVLLAATVLAAPAAAFAQPVDGLYVGAGAGYNYLSNIDPKFKFSVVSNNSQGQLTGNGGFIGSASIGYGFGNGLRLEVQGDYRQDHQRLKNSIFDGGTSDTQSYGGYLNALFDFDIGVPWVYPYIGAGVGYRETELKNFNAYLPGTTNGFTLSGSEGGFSAQGMLGAAFPFPGLPGLSITTEYRFTGVFSNETFSGSSNFATNNNLNGNRVRVTLANQYNNSFLIGLRYAFNVPAPPPPPAPPAPVPVATPSRTYLVFFDWDRYDLTARARQIIAEAAANAPKVQTTRIEVNGHADLTGTPAYNQRLSVRRAEAVAAELVRDGIPRNEIFTQGFGDTKPLVPTARGVREPQNRRVEIILK